MYAMPCRFDCSYMNNLSVCYFVWERSCAHCTTWSSDDCAVQESCFLKLKCDDGDADDAHGSV
jgi:hypothetical protein